MTRLLTAALLALAFAASTRAASLPSAEDYARLVAALTDAVVVAGYRRYAQVAAALATSAERFRDDPTPARLAQTRADFHAAMDAWEHVQGIAFGPVMDGFGPARIQFWPDRRGIGARQLRAALASEDPQLLDRASLAQKSVALGDLQTLEWLLFDGDDARLLAAHGFRRGFAASVARYQAEVAARLLAAWTADGGFRREILEAGRREGTYQDSAEAAREFLETLAGILDLVVAEKLERPLDEDAATARPTLAESWRSRRSLANVAANLETARDLHATPGGFGDLLTGVGSGPLAEGMTRDFEAAIASARGAGVSLHDAVGDATLRPRIEALLEQVRDLRDLVTAIMAPEIDLPIGFNASDGD